VIPPSGRISEAPITLHQLISGDTSTGLTSNARFTPLDDASEAPPFEGTLHLAGATMGVITDAPGGQISNPVHGKDTTYFPDVDLSFITDGQQLVPDRKSTRLNSSHIL